MKETNQQEIPRTGFARLPQIVPKYFPVSKSTWWQGVRDGRYPKPVKLSPRVTCWRWEDLHALIESFGK